MLASLVRSLAGLSPSICSRPGLPTEAGPKLGAGGRGWWGHPPARGGGHTRKAPRDAWGGQPNGPRGILASPGGTGPPLRGAGQTSPEHHRYITALGRFPTNVPAMTVCEESWPFLLDRNICNFLWYGGVAGEGLRSVGEEALPSSKSVCFILPIARRLAGRGPSGLRSF